MDVRFVVFSYIMIIMVISNLGWRLETCKVGECRFGVAPTAYAYNLYVTTNHDISSVLIYLNLAAFVRGKGTCVLESSSFQMADM